MIYVLSGGAVGATLIVSCPSNVTVTVSKGNKTYTKNSGDLGSATFKGLDAGTWTVKIQNSSQTATKNITITTDYEITMAFFAAYINITYPANSTCTVKTSGGVTVASNSNAGTSTKTWRATVGATGTYTITATATDGSGKSKSTTVSITADGQSKSVTLNYEQYLIKNGVPDETTGGFTLGSTNNGAFVFSAPAAGSSYVSTSKSNNTITRGQYTTLKFDGYIKDAGNSYVKYGNSSVKIDATSRKTISLDISSINSAQIVFEMFVLSSTAYMYIYNLWIE